MINHLLVAEADNHARKRFASYHRTGFQTAIEIWCQNKIWGYSYPVHYTALFHNQEGYYSGLIFEAFDAPPQVGGVFICCTICNVPFLWFYSILHHTVYFFKYIVYILLQLSFAGWVLSWKPSPYCLSLIFANRVRRPSCALWMIPSEKALNNICTLLSSEIPPHFGCFWPVYAFNFRCLTAICPGQTAYSFVFFLG